MHHSAAHTLLRCRRYRDQGQPQPVLAELEQASGKFDWPRACLDEQGLVERHEPFVDASDLLEVAAAPGVVQIGAKCRRNIRGHRNAAVSTLGQERHHRRVLARH